MDFTYEGTKTLIDFLSDAIDRWEVLSDIENKQAAQGRGKGQ